MVKDPGSAYQPGRRGLGWLKLKKALATLDCVVVGVEWGHGKRRGVLSDYTFAVRASDEPDAPLLTIGKAYTGLTDAEIATMTEHFKAITLRDHGRYRTVVPEVVVEIAFDRIMRSARHRSGFAMRFPRIVRIRDDKTPARDRHAGHGGGALRRAGLGPDPAGHRRARRDGAHHGHRRGGGVAGPHAAPVDHPQPGANGRTAAHRRETRLTIAMRTR